jgi:hypothetical protein
MNDYRQDNLTIHNEDCMEIISRYDDNYFDLAVVDPPHGIVNKPKINDYSGLIPLILIFHFYIFLEMIKLDIGAFKFFFLWLEMVFISYYIIRRLDDSKEVNKEFLIVHLFIWPIVLINTIELIRCIKRIKKTA